MAEDTAEMTVTFSRDLRERARRAAKRLHTNTTRLINEALDEKLLTIEARFRQEELQREAEEAAKKMKREPYRGERGIGSSPLPSLTQARTSLASPAPDQDPMEALYLELAASLVAAGNDKTEFTRRVAAAIAAVRRERPLTSPPDDKILATLEHYYLRVKEDGSTVVRTVDDFVGKVLDVSRIKTSGVTE